MFLRMPIDGRLDKKVGDVLDATSPFRPKLRLQSSLSVHGRDPESLTAVNQRIPSICRNDKKVPPCMTPRISWVTEAV